MMLNLPLKKKRLNVSFSYSVTSSVILTIIVLICWVLFFSALKAYLGEESYSQKKDLCQQKIKDGEKLEKPLRATKAILKVISAEKETTEESLKVRRIKVLYTR